MPLSKVIDAHASQMRPDHGLSAHVVSVHGHGWQIVGEGTFNWSVFRFYRAKLLSESGTFDETQPYILEIVYLRRITASQIAQITASEIKRMQFADTPDAHDLPDKWALELEHMLPNVSLGDKLVGVFMPGKGVWFYDAHQSLGHIQAPAFVKAFTAIWLDPQTRAPKLRDQLLGSTKASSTIPVGSPV